LVSPGQHVRKGELIAAVGSTGESTGPHLHYQVMRDGVAIDPMPFLHGVPAAATALLPVKPAVQ
jgi:murein DD-endopeptidase MepM/ murein hydrolase activator NlpD